MTAQDGKDKTQGIAAVRDQTEGKWYMGMSAEGTPVPFYANHMGNSNGE